MKIFLLQFSYAKTTLDSFEKDFITVAVIGFNEAEAENWIYKNLEKAFDLWGRPTCYRWYETKKNKIIPVK